MVESCGTSEATCDVPVPAASPDGKELAGRLRETLAILLEGKSEKQAAVELDLSHHTVHVYVKVLYKLFGVSSRCELLANVYREALGGARGRRGRGGKAMR